MADRGISDSNGGSPCEPPERVWLIAALAVILAAGLAGPWLASGTAAAGAAVAIMLFGLPHGAFDIQLILRSMGGGGKGGIAGEAPLVLILYLALIGAAAALWLWWPDAALLLFLIMAAGHFGEDWTMVEAGILRLACGSSLMATIAVASPDAATLLFAALATPTMAAALASGLLMAAPVIGGLTLVAMSLAWGTGQKSWVIMHLLAIGIAGIAPPIVAFAAWFVLVHSASHLGAARRTMADWPLTRFGSYALMLSIASVAGGLVVTGADATIADPTASAVFLFQLLAVLTVPHLLLTHGWLPWKAALRAVQPARTTPSSPNSSRVVSSARNML